MKGTDKTMNHIVEEEKKDELTTHIEDGYKVIYPNNNVKIKLIRYYKRHVNAKFEISSVVHSGLTCRGLNLFDRISHRTDLFLMPCIFDNGGCSDLEISRANAKASFELGSRVNIYSGEKYLGSGTQFHEKIKYILFNQNTNHLRILIDNNFKTKSAQKHERIQNEKKKLEKELDLDLS